MNRKLVSVIIPTLNRRDDVVNCISSVLSSDYKEIEVIVVDNASKDNTVKKIQEIFGENYKVRLIQSDINLGAAGGRNKGESYANGEYLLFVDCDNVIDRRMISYLVEFFENKIDCGMVGPLMLFKDNPSLIWIYSADINMWTSRALYQGTGEKDKKQYKEIEEVGHIPNCFMVKKEDFEKIGGFDEKYLIMFEEADLAEKIKKRLKNKIYLYTKAKTYHNVDLPNTDGKSFGFRSKERAFLTARNRIYFMRKNASIFQLLIFLFFYNPLIFIYYQFFLIKNKQYEKAWFYLRGNIEGLFM